MDQGTLQGIATIFAMVAFIGVCWWAYSSHKKKDFDEAAQLPFVDEELDDERPVGVGEKESHQASQDSSHDPSHDNGKEQHRS